MVKDEKKKTEEEAEPGTLKPEAKKPEAPKAPAPKPEALKTETAKPKIIKLPEAPAVAGTPKAEVIKISGGAKPKPVEAAKEVKPKPVEAAKEVKPKPIEAAKEVKPKPIEAVKEVKPKPVEAAKEVKPTPVKLPEEKTDQPIGPKTLDNLSVEAIDGIGSIITVKLKAAGIKTLDELTRTNPADIYEQVKVPIHKLMEYQKKAEKILELELDEEIIDALASKNYTIEKAIEEKPEVLQQITQHNKTQVMNFLGKVIQITMFLDATTCRTNSIAILHRLKKKPVKAPEEEKPKEPVGKTGVTLEALPVSAIDGIGPKIEEKLKNLGITTLEHLVKANPSGIYLLAKAPIHKMMEYRKKAQMILQLELDEKIINALAEKNYTIAQAIEEDIETIKKLSGQDKEQVLEFIDNVVQITMFLDAYTCRTNSIAILHKAKKEPGKPKPGEPQEEEIRYLGKEQILAKIYSTELDYTVFRLLRERAMNKSELLKVLENKLIRCTPSQINEVFNLLVQAELVQMEWFEGNFDVHLFLISDFMIFRTPPFKIMEEAEKNLPTPLVAEKYQAAVRSFFATYRPNEKDNLFIAQLLRDPDIFVTLSLVRSRMYPLKKFPKGMKDGVDMRSIIDKMIEAGILKIIEDETKQEWVLLLTDLRAPQFYPEYMLENVRLDAAEKKITTQLAAKHLDLLELHYDTFYEIYSKFFKGD